MFGFSFLDNSKRFGFIKSLEMINMDLKEHNIFSFHHRLVFRLCLFIHKILFQSNAPKQLKLWLVFNDKQKLGISLRSVDVINFMIPKTKSKYGDLYFSNFFSRFWNKLNFDSFDRSFEKFKYDRLENRKINNDLVILLKYFPKFSCYLNYFFLFN